MVRGMAKLDVDWAIPIGGHPSPWCGSGRIWTPGRSPAHPSC